MTGKQLVPDEERRIWGIFDNMFGGWRETERMTYAEAAQKADDMCYIGPSSTRADQTRYEAAVRTEYRVESDKHEKEWLR